MHIVATSLQPQSQRQGGMHLCVFVHSHSDTVQRVVVCLFAGLQLHKKVDRVILEKNVLILVMILAYLHIVPVSVVIVHWVNPVR